MTVFILIFILVLPAGVGVSTRTRTGIVGAGFRLVTNTSLDGLHLDELQGEIREVSLEGGGASLGVDGTTRGRAVMIAIGLGSVLIQSARLVQI